MTPMPENSTWFVAQVAAIVHETPTITTITFTLPHTVEHLAGQHYEIRLTAEDGYQAARLYSAASAAGNGNQLDLSIAYVPEGEVTPYVTQSLQVGDEVEIRGPLGKFFVWKPDEKRPVLLIAGGSGVVPMHAILQAHSQAVSTAPMALLYSVRSFDEIMYKDAFLTNKAVTITITDSVPDTWQGATGMITTELISLALQRFPTRPVCYICGRTPFVEAMAGMLLAEGVPPVDIKAERFG